MLTMTLDLVDINKRTSRSPCYDPELGFVRSVGCHDVFVKYEFSITGRLRYVDLLILKVRVRLKVSKVVPPSAVNPAWG